MNTKIQEKKNTKMEKLYDAAYRLFTTQGVSGTVVDDITKSAGVAKGTFYLYCRDKYDLVDKLILRKSSRLLEEAMKALMEDKKKHALNFQQSVVFFVDYLVNIFRNDTKFLELIFQNLSPGLYDKIFRCKEMEETRVAFIKNFMLNGGSGETAAQRLYLIICMLSMVCYNSIVLKIPFGFDEIKSELYLSIQRILT